MKIQFLFISLCLTAAFVFMGLHLVEAQVPEGLSYQAVARDGAGQVLKSQNMDVTFEVRESSMSGTVIYEETHAVTTNDYGLFTATIGMGTAVTGTFSGIPWGANDHFLRVLIDPGSGFVNMGTTQLMSVPYSLMSKKAATATVAGTATNMEIDELTDVNSPSPSSGQVLKWNGSAWAPGPDNGGTPSPWTTVGSDIHYTSGDVGIGTTSPNARLEVKDNPSVLARVSSTTGTSSLQLFRTGAANIDWGFIASTGNELQLNSSNSEFTGSTVRMRFKSNGDITMAQTEGRVGIGTNSPGNPFSVLQATGTINTVRFESQVHPTGKDLLELVVPSGSTSGSQFIEMQNGSTIVAAINSDGSSRFKSVKFHDNTSQETSGPLTKAYLDAVSSVSTTVNVIGSSAITATFNTTDKYIEVTYTGVSMTQNSHMVQVTPIRVNTNAATVDRSASVYYTGGKVRIYVWDQSINGATFNDCFITIYDL